MAMPWEYIFNAKDAPNAPTSYPAMEARRRIAQAMLSGQRKGYPKNLGEGLTAIGDAIGERGVMDRLLAQEAAYTKQVNDASETAVPAEALPTSRVSSYAPTENVQPAPTVPDNAPGSSAENPIDPAIKNPLDMGADTPAGFRPAPAYLRSSLESLVPDPARRAYLGHLAGKEAQSATEVSPTGAAGPFQFTRGTGRQYGLMPNGQDLRADIPASIRAVNQFTDDNAKVLTQALGRPPTPGELALAHQQGAVTAVKMLTGTGNAPANNLAVNNVNPGAAPQAAADKIMSYYGMPGARDRMATTLAGRTAPGVPPVNPTLPGTDQSALPLSGQPAAPGGGLPPEITQGFSTIKTAPPAQSEVKAVPPPVQVAQATSRPPSLEDFPMTADEARGRRIYAKGAALQDPGLMAQGKALVEYGADIRNKKYEAAMKTYQDRLVQEREKEKFYREGGAASVQQKEGEAALKTEEAEIVRRTGKTPAQFYPELDKEKSAVDQIAKAQASQQLARKAISAGVITGYGANMKINTAKFADFAFKNGLSGDMAANTEIMSAALKAGLPQAIETINGVGGKVSDADVKIAQGIQGTDPELQMKTIKTIMDRAAEINNSRIKNYEEKVDAYLGGHRQERNYTINTTPVAPPDQLNMLLEDPNKVVNGRTLREHFDRAHGPGSADLEISRFKRAQRRGGG